MTTIRQSHHLQPSAYKSTSEAQISSDQQRGWADGSETMAMAFKMATEGMRVKQECLSSFMEMKWKKVSRSVSTEFCYSFRSPTASRIRSKILYATSKQGLRRLLEGIHYEVQATDPTEMGFDVIKERAK
ncbi:hypothetical protein C4D60_Mb05t20730 [Musa balbisiana]|uniref:ADF-H domain-containing protein n=1 Tax=Musa balbisiana TaxID=52838 RepID=A0A4S8JXP3_MUSBA|nr:hypothetical protein C4D60_Mb05t20730 [Musa balbisiana]